MTPNELLNEITNGPLAAELADALAAGDDVTIHSILNRKDIDKQDWISVADFNTWCANNNAEYVRIVQLSQDVESPFYAAANSLLRLLVGALAEKAINTGAPSVSYLLENWPYVDPTVKESLLALGRIKISRAEQLEVSITTVDVIKALYNDDGTRRVL